MPSLKPQEGAIASHGKSTSAQLDGASSNRGNRNGISQKQRQPTKASYGSGGQKAESRKGDIDPQKKVSRGSVSAGHITSYKNLNGVKNESGETGDDVSDIPNIIKTTPRKKFGVPSGRKRTYVVEPDERVITDNNVIIDTNSEMGAYFKERLGKKKQVEPRVTKSDKGIADSEKIVRQRKQLKASLPRFKDDIASRAGTILPPLKDVAKTKGLTPRTGANIAQDSGRSDRAAQGGVSANKSAISKGTLSANNKMDPKLINTSIQTDSKAQSTTLGERPPDLSRKDPDAMQKYVAAHESFRIREMKARAHVGGRDYVQRGDPSRMCDYEQIRQSLQVGADKTVYPAYVAFDQESDFTSLTTITLPDLKTPRQGEDVQKETKAGCVVDSARNEIKKGQQTTARGLDDQRQTPTPNVASQKGVALEKGAVSPKDKPNPVDKYQDNQSKQSKAGISKDTLQAPTAQGQQTTARGMDDKRQSPTPNVASQKGAVSPKDKPAQSKKRSKFYTPEVTVTSPVQTPNFLRAQLLRRESQITDVTSRNSSAVHSGRASLVVSPIINVTSPEPIKEEPLSINKKKVATSKDGQKDKANKTTTLTTKSRLSHNSSKSRLSQNSTKSRMTLRPTSAPEEGTDSKPPSGKVAHQDGSPIKRENSDPGDSATAQRTSSHVRQRQTLRVKPVPRGFLLSPNAITENNQPPKAPKLKSTAIGKTGKVYIQRKTQQKTQQNESKKDRKTKLTLPKIKDKRVSPNALSDVEVDAADSIQRSLRLFNL